MFNAAAFAVNLCEKLHGCCGAQHTPCLQRRILDYFNENDDNYDLPNKMGQSRFVQIFTFSVILLEYLMPSLL